VQKPTAAQDPLPGHPRACTEAEGLPRSNESPGATTQQPTSRCRRVLAWQAPDVQVDCASWSVVRDRPVQRMSRPNSGLSTWPAILDGSGVSPEPSRRLGNGGTTSMALPSSDWLGSDSLPPRTWVTIATADKGPLRNLAASRTAPSPNAKLCHTVYIQVARARAPTTSLRHRRSGADNRQL
jgi:hypothetical protein